MNKYEAAGLALEAAAGKEVMVLSYNPRAARRSFDATAEVVHTLDGVKISANAGRIVFPGGGIIRFVGRQQLTDRMRGSNLAIIFIEDDREPLGAELMDAVRYLHSRGVEVVSQG